MFISLDLDAQVKSNHKSLAQQALEVALWLAIHAIVFPLASSSNLRCCGRVSRFIYKPKFGADTLALPLPTGVRENIKSLFTCKSQFLIRPVDEPPTTLGVLASMAQFRRIFHFFGRKCVELIINMRRGEDFSGLKAITDANYGVRDKKTILEDASSTLSVIASRSESDASKFWGRKKSRVRLDASLKRQFHDMPRCIWIIVATWRSLSPGHVRHGKHAVNVSSCRAGFWGNKNSFISS